MPLCCLHGSHSLICKMYSCTLRCGTFFRFFFCISFLFGVRFACENISVCHSCSLILIRTSLANTQPWTLSQILVCISHISCYNFVCLSIWYKYGGVPKKKTEINVDTAAHHTYFDKKKTDRQFVSDWSVCVFIASKILTRKTGRKRSGSEKIPWDKQSNANTEI